jgi:DNA-directed RNA polymerase specialized sigma24 family protein
MQLLATVVVQSTLPVTRDPLVTWSPPVWETWEGMLSHRVKNIGFARSSITRHVPRGARPVPTKYKFVPSMSLIHAMRVGTSPAGTSSTSNSAGASSTSNSAGTSSTSNSLRPDGRGIDLAKRGDEVRKLFYAAFARGLVKDGFDPEEALQEVFKGLLSRNRGTCPFDVKKSSFGHYVHIVTRCVLANYVRKEKKRVIHEVSGESFSLGDSDGASSREWEIPVPATQEDSRRRIDYLRERIANVVPSGADQETVIRALKLMAEGHTRREAASIAKLDARVLNAALESLKSARSS